MKRLFALLLALLCLTGLASAESFTMAGYDGQDASHDWATNGFFTRMESRTGLSFSHTVYNDYTQWTSAKTAILNGTAKLPDVLFKAALTPDEVLTGLNNGTFIDLAPLLPEYAPELWSILQAHPDWLAAVTTADGRIGALPFLTEMPTQNALWINRDWLQELKLDLPTDMESLRTVLKAFRDRDPNMNSKKDEIPLTFLGPWDLKFFSQAWGVVVNDYNVYQDEDGKVHYWPLEDSFIEMITVLKEMYGEKLLDQDGFTTVDSLRAITDSKATLTYGAFFAPSPMNLVTADMSKSFTLLTPFACNGKIVFRDMGLDIVTGCFAITSACKDPAALLRWVDILYTEEGAVEAMVGKEGENYKIDPDTGLWSYMGEVSMTALNETSIYDTGNMPWLFPKAFYQRFNDTEIARMCGCLNELAQYVKKPTERVTFTGENRQELIRLQNELGSYVDTTLARWIIGDLAFNENSIAKFREELNRRGASDMVALWEKQLNEAVR